jgi:hypothetical protein
MMRGLRTVTVLCAAAGMAAAKPGMAADILQCVPYARIVSGIDIRGDAWTWWNQAEGRFARGHVPRRGAVLAFQPNGPMVLGHVAVVSRILSGRQILIRHANWSTPGAIEEDVLAIDVSPGGDWSQVRIWHSPSGRMGARINPTYGFIYSPDARLRSFSPGAGDTDDGNRLIPTPRFAGMADDPESGPRSLRGKPPRLKVSPAIFAMEDMSVRGPRRYAALEEPGRRRALVDIIADVKREARLR